MHVHIIDIDNCIADDEHRIRLIDHNQSDPDASYHDYHAAGAHDYYMPVPPLLLGPNDTINPDSDVKPCILFVTSTPEQFRLLKERWLSIHIPPHFQRWLLMRPQGNHEHSDTLKPRLVKEWRDDLERKTGKSIYFLDAYDDRTDVLRAYRRELGCNTILHALNLRVFECELRNEPEPQRPVDAASHLEAMAKTFRERNAVYKDNYKMVGRVMEAFFPDGVTLKTQDDFNRWHLFELKIIKLTRFVNSGLLHPDSLTDDGVYSAMILRLLDDNPQPINPGA